MPRPPHGVLTGQIHSNGWVRSKHTRLFMCAVDATTCSERALEWLMENLVDDGDEVVAVRILDPEQFDMDLDSVRTRAHNLLSSIVELNETAEERKVRAVIPRIPAHPGQIAVSVEFITGAIRTYIMRLVAMYRPDSLTISTRGKPVSAIQKMLGSTPLGSISKYVFA